MTFQILTVCTANICRSPAIALRLQQGLANAPVAVSSAGVRAIEGMPMCAQSASFLPGSAQVQVAAHNSRPITAPIIRESDLILTADRSHRAEIAKLVPSARNRLFTIRQAAPLAEWLASDDGGFAVALTKRQGRPVVLEKFDPRDMIDALPDTPKDRLHWLVQEMDNARGLVAPTPLPDTAWTPEDIGDPHDSLDAPHATVASAIKSAVDTLLLAVNKILAAP